MATPVSSMTHSSFPNSQAAFSATNSSATVSSVARKYIFSFRSLDAQRREAYEAVKIYRVITQGKHIDVLASDLPSSVLGIFEKLPPLQPSSASSNVVNKDQDVPQKRACAGRKITKRKKEDESPTSEDSFKTVQLPPGLFAPEIFKIFTVYLHGRIKVDIQLSFEEGKEFANGCQYFAQEGLFRDTLHQLAKIQELSPENEEYIAQKILDLLSAKPANRSGYTAELEILKDFIDKHPKKYLSFVGKYAQTVPEISILAHLALHNLGLAISAFEVLERGARKSPEMACCIGDYYEFTMTNHQESFKWYYRAAVEGVARAQFNVGCLYETQVGGADIPSALSWYNKAAVQGYVAAKTALERIQKNTITVNGGYLGGIASPPSLAAPGNNG